jgi:photosystem II stability/assembly factor-like uncharacterized protein
MTTQRTWRKTNAPTASSRTDDIWFVNERVGWAVNSNGHILKTTDAGASWVRQFAAGVYLRCIGFADERTGWVGTFAANRLLFHTDNGGSTWQQVTALPAGAPVKVCGIAVVNAQVVYVAGSNEPRDPPRMMKTIDGGRTWAAWDMRAHASILIDTYFVDEQRGWVVGGKADDPSPRDRSEIKPVVLFTEDGGRTWVNRLAGQEAEFPFGEWGWKIQFVHPQLGFVSLENFVDAAILKTTDGGRTFVRIPVADPQGNANLEGVGFLDESHGWVGGWGDSTFQSGFSSATEDGGVTWRNANEIGRFLNRFRFIGNPLQVGYASGDTVYRYSIDAVPAPTPVGVAPITPPALMLDAREMVATALPLSVPVVVPLGTRRVTVDVWSRFGHHYGRAFDESDPVAGSRVIVWEGRESDGRPVPDGQYIVRVTADSEAESTIVTLRRRSERGRARTIRWIRHEVRVPPGSPARALTGLSIAPDVETVPIDLPNLSAFPTAVQKAEFLLQAAAEVEHALLVQYLYAAYSLKKPTAFTDPQQREAVRSWSDWLAGIAREEMGHLLTVQNLLLLLDKRPNFEREDFPQIPNLYPFRMQLEPLTHRSLAKYVVAESPIDATGIADIVDVATMSGGGVRPNHVGVLYGLLGVVFTRPEQLNDPLPPNDPWLVSLQTIRALAYKQDNDPSHWHLPDAAFNASSRSRQAPDEEWSPSREVRVFTAVDRDTALRAIRDISIQGEGPTQPLNDPQGSHFQRFLRAYRGDAAILAFPNGEWAPALDVPTNPVLEGAPGDSGVIHEAKAKAVAALANVRYALLLGFLEQYFLLDASQRAFLIDWCFAEMGTLRMLSTRLTAMPRSSTPSAVAALPFTLPDILSLSSQEPAQRWQIHADRFRAALALIDEVLAVHAASDPQLRTLLTQLKNSDEPKLQRVVEAAQGNLPSAPMGRWERVRRILNAAIGFGSARHGRFWEQPLATFITDEFDTVRYIADPGPDRGKRSGLVQALRGTDRFDGSEFARMPMRRAPIADDLIDFIEQWIDDDCPEI